MRWGIFSFLFWLINFCFISGGRSQDIFDYENSKSYANYLFELGRFENAKDEFHRVIFMRPLDTMSWVYLIKSYHRLNRHFESLRFIEEAEDNFQNPVLPIGKLKVYSMFVLGSFRDARTQLNNYTFSDEDDILLSTLSYSLNGEWQKAYNHSLVENPSHLVQQANMIAFAAISRRKKSPFLAGLLSSFIPGLGKIYTGRWKDGLFSMLLFTTTGWQAYRTISGKGLSNPGSWFFGGMAIGFYSGNIYGSVKSAKKFNEIEEDKYEARSWDLLDVYFGY